MGWITLLLSGLPAYVTLEDLGYYLECIFTTNSEIGMFEVRHLPEENDKRQVALDFRSGFDAIAAQEQLDGYRYQMQDGVQYILRAKITNKKEYLRSDTSPEFSLSSRNSSEEKENSSAMSISSMSDVAMLRANAKLNAKYKLLKKQKLIVEAQMELIRERRKLRREFARRDFDSDDEPICCSRKPRSRTPSREHRSFSRDQDTYKTKQAAKVQELKAIDKEFASISKLRSPQWDKDFEKQSLEIKSKSNSPDRSLRRYKIQEVEKKSRVRSRAVRSRSLTRSSTSRSRSPRPKPLRSRSRTRRSSHNRSCSRDTEYRDRSSKRITKRKERSHDRISKSKRLRSPESGSTSRKSRLRNRCGLLAIMPKSPVKRKSSILRTQPSNWKEFKNMGSNSCKTQPCNWKEYKNMGSNTCRTQPSYWKEYKNIESKDSTIPVVLQKVKNTDKKILKDTFRNIDSSDKKVDFKNNPLEMKQGNADRKKSRSDETMIRLICDDIMFLMKSLLLEISIKENIVISDRTNEVMIEKLNAIVQERVKIIYVEKSLTIYNAWEIYRKICTKEDDILLLKTMLAKINTQEAATAETRNRNTLAEGANGNDSTKNSNRAISNVELDTVAHDSTLKYEHRNEDQVIELISLETDIENKATDTTEVLQVIDVETYCPKESSIKVFSEGANGNDSTENSNRASSNVELDTIAHDITVKYRNEDQVIEQTSLETDNGNKATEVVQVIDIETYCPKEFSIKASEKHKTVPANPQFVLVIKRLMKQLKATLRKSREKGVFVNHFHMRQVLKILVTDMLSNEEYKTTPEIIHFFRQKYPRDKDEEFIEKVAEAINMKKYDLDGVDRERQEDTDVILIETKPEIITIEDSDGK
ncbi:uncharacterized protein [Choristoneura fumiferana]|uniref:uncharacterized protein n=1 Tax=Choristoneura fumiferana TaxID=7141 RepID=UPI003D153B48